MQNNNINNNNKIKYIKVLINFKKKVYIIY